jgi:hypothetical protein
LARIEREQNAINSNAARATDVASSIGAVLTIEGNRLRTLPETLRVHNAPLVLRAAGNPFDYVLEQDRMSL